MKEYLNQHTVANTIRMTRSQHSGSFLVVEGDSDVRVYKRLVSKNDCFLIPAHNKDNAVEAVEQLEKEGFPGVLAVVDADFNHLEGYKPESANIFLTDSHDLETMIMSTPEVVEKILDELGNNNRIKRLGKTPIEMVIEAALPIGILRRLNQPHMENLRIKFRELLAFDQVGTFMNKATLEVNLKKLLAASSPGSANDFDESLIGKKIRSEKKAGHDPWQVCCGHDLVLMFTVGLCDAFGNKSARGLTPSLLEVTLRTAYESSYFSRTRLHLSIKEWETINPDYRVLN